MSDYPMSMPMQDERQLPVLYLREQDLPELRNWQIGGDYYVLVKVKQLSKEKVEEGSREDQSRMEAKFQMLSIKALDQRPISIKEIESAEFEDIYAKARSGELST